MKKITILALLSVGACSGPQAVHLRDPAGHVAECKADPWAVWSWDIKSWQDECAHRLERNGYQQIK